MSLLSQTCGTPARYGAGCRCTECTSAVSAYQKRLVLRRQRGEVKVPAIGAIRRLHALMALGWPLEAIARRGGWAGRASLASILTYCQRSQTVLRTTHQRIAAVYDRLSGTPGPSKITRRQASKRGYAPPLAWDDIDNDRAPKGMAA